MLTEEEAEVRIQGTFREQSGNIQGIFSALLLQSDVVLLTEEETEVRIQGTFMNDSFFTPYIYIFGRSGRSQQAPQTPQQP